MIIALARPFHRLLSSKLVSGVVVGGLMTAIVKAVAFAKEVVVANRFGTSSQLDAFLVAAVIPTMIAIIGGEGFRDAVMPAYAALRRKIGAPAARLFSNMVWIGVLALVTAAVMVIFAGDALASILGAGFSEEKRALTEEFQLLLLPFAVFFGAATILKGFLQSHFRFALSSIAPAIVPVVTILLLVVMPGTADGSILAIGMSLGAAIFLAVMVIAAQRIDRRSLQRPGWDASTRGVLGNVIPLLAGSAIYEGCGMIDRIMAATLDPGSVAVLSYAERTATIVTTLGGITAGQVLFPHIAELAARQDWARVRRVSLQFSAAVVIGSLPFCLAFWIAADPIVKLLFEHGNFTAADRIRVADVFRVTGLYIPGFILTLLGGRIVMALQAGRVILITTAVGFLNNIAFNYLFMQLFGVKGIALSTAVVSVITAAILFTCMLRKISILERQR